MSDLLTLAYKAPPPAPRRALPSMWDGRDVEWASWTDAFPMFICPQPKEAPACERCGSTRPTMTCSGHVKSLPGDEGWLTHRSRSGRTWEEWGPMLVGSPCIWLYASRCYGCGLDIVWERGRNRSHERFERTWVLDESDYGPEGSFRHCHTTQQKGKETP